MPISKRDTPTQAYYVYALVDPRDHKVFYIGKGKGRRYAAHLAEWRSGKVVNARKSVRIGEICAAGLVPSVEFIEKNLTEIEALRLERREIRSRSGLTNLSRGRQSQAEIAAEQARAQISRMVTWDSIPVAERSEFKWDLYCWIRYALEALADMRMPERDPPKLIQA